MSLTVMLKIVSAALKTEAKAKFDLEAPRGQGLASRTTSLCNGNNHRDNRSRRETKQRPEVVKHMKRLDSKAYNLHWQLLHLPVTLAPHSYTGSEPLHSCPSGTHSNSYQEITYLALLHC